MPNALATIKIPLSASALRLCPQVIRAFPEQCHPTICVQRKIIDNPLVLP
jgi:hypothetical protein